MVQKKGDRVVDRLGIDNVVVVEEKSEVVLDRMDFIDQGGQDRLDRWWLRRMQQRKCVRANLGLDLLQGCDEIGPEECRVIVALIKRDPSCDPFAGWGSGKPFS